MNKLIPLLIKYKVVVIIVTILLIALSLVAATGVNINYDMAKYLPGDSLTTKSIKVAQDEFGFAGMSDVMVENLTITEGVKVKKLLLSIDGIKNISWLDDVADITTPVEIIPEDILHNFFKDGFALYRIEFFENDYSMKTDEALNEIRQVLEDNGYKAYYSGTAEEAKSIRGIVDDEAFKIAAVVVPLCILILILASRSWIEPIVYLVVIGISVAFNMGTNIIFKNVSFVTFSMSAILQLAISLDYSLFVFHRYLEERDEGKDYIPAITNAVSGSFSSVLGSAMTTIAGFLALLFMSYRIGADMGLVLAKGVAFSFLSVIFIMPVILYLLRKVIDKTSHRSFMPSFVKMSRMTIKLRYVFATVGIVVLIVSFLAQSNNTFIYGDTSADIESKKEDSTSDSFLIEDKFGTYNPISLMVPKGDLQSEIEIAKQIEKLPGVLSVISLPTVADPAIPVEMLPSDIVDMFYSENFARINIMLKDEAETQANYYTVEAIHEISDDHYSDDWYLAGKTSSLYDIRESVEKDKIKVSLFSILAVFIIVSIIMRSVSIPVILLAVIQGSIWINMGIPYFGGTKLLFIGYMIISAIQLGATIDYAILISNRYKEYRILQQPKEAAASAVSTAGLSVAVSSLILTVAGFAEGLLSDLPSVSEIGVLLGRGAALSGIMVIFVLPGLLVFFDTPILKTTLGLKNAIKKQKKIKKVAKN